MCHKFVLFGRTRINLSKTEINVKRRICQNASDDENVKIGPTFSVLTFSSNFLFWQIRSFWHFRLLTFSFFWQILRRSFYSFIGLSLFVCLCARFFIYSIEFSGNSHHRIYWIWSIHWPLERFLHRLWWAEQSDRGCRYSGFEGVCFCDGCGLS